MLNLRPLLLCGCAALVLTPRAFGQGVDVTPSRFELTGLHEGRQLVVSAGARDRTRQAKYTATPPGVVRVTEQGYVRPIGKGEAVVTVEADGRKAEVRVTVKEAD